MPTTRSSAVSQAQSLTASIIVSCAAALTVFSTPVASASPLREVLIVGNNWEGTADVISSTAPYEKIARINAVPDFQERLAEMHSSPVKTALFLGNRYTTGEGHDQLIDDIYSTPDGSAVVLSRPSFADVVSIDVRTNAINWRFPIAGSRADHMAVSPDGRSVAVSASLANTVHILDINTGDLQGQFTTGDRPHENVYTNGGKYLWNMAIGDVITPFDDPALDFTKGDRKITIIDTATFEIIRTIDMREKLDDFGRHDLSDAIRPVSFSPDEKNLYFQVSFFGGIVEYNVDSDSITRIQELPQNPAVNLNRTTWVNDSRHHGLAMSSDGKNLCVAGTMDDYVAIVDHETLTPASLVPTNKPYWATVSGDGSACIISESGSDTVSAISFETGERVAQIEVGDHPQRIRLGQLPSDWFGTAKQ
ncbi:MAG: YncE family protein [Mycobacteriaceae bacterium]